MLPLAYSHSSDSCRQFVQLRGWGGMMNLLRYLDSIVDCNKKGVLRRCLQYIYNILSGSYIPLMLT